ncbi:MAG TPA: hypothetical protein VFE76_07930, partial [Myxococcales bacterium]|nr:hypothetical protein [Myxococcales bacterium]
AKGIAMRNVQLALSSLNVPTAEDVKKLEGKIEELERVFETLSVRISDLAKKNSREPPADS